MRTLILLIFATINCFSQTVDSLLYQLKNIPNDTERVNQIYKAGFEIRNSNPEVAYQYALVCEQEALKSNSNKHLAKSYNLLGVLFFKKGDYTSAVKFQKKALGLNQAAKYNLGMAINQTNLGNIYTELNYFNQAEAYYLKALQTYNILDNKLQITRCLMNIGSLKNDQKQYEAAKMQFKEALVYANEIGDLELISDCNSNIGTNFINLNNLDSALIYLEEGLKLREMIDNELEKANSYNNLAHLHILKKEFEKAKNYLDLSQAICDKYDYPEAKVELFGTLSFYYEAQQQFESALIWQKKQVALNDSLQKLDKENSQLQFLDEEQLPTKTASGDTNKLWLYGIIGLLCVIIVVLIIKRKNE